MLKLQKQLSGNRGEWSEIYVFFYLLAHGRLYAADQNLNKIDLAFYKILEVFRDEGSFGFLSFKIDDEAGQIEVWRDDTETKILTISQEQIEFEANRLYNLIQVSGGEYFIKLNLQVRFMK